MSNTKKSGGALLGAAFLMATSAIGPGFLTQTATFTGQHGSSFGFVILVSVIMSAIAQINIWRVLCVSGLRGQDVANKLLPGLGYFVSFMIVLGGLVFNIGNVGGGALGFNTLLGVPTEVGYVLAGALAILVFVVKNAKAAMDTAAKIICGAASCWRCPEKYLRSRNRCFSAVQRHPDPDGRHGRRLHYFCRRSPSD